MQTFYADTSLFSGDIVKLSGKEHHHATCSCRVKVGEIIAVTDGCGKKVEARITTIDSQILTARIERDLSGYGELASEIIIALSLIKPARYEFAVEKCTELGVRGFIPLVTSLCEIKPGRFNRERLAIISLEASKQSGRSWIPVINQPVNITELFTCVKGPFFAAVKSADTSAEKAMKNFPEGCALTLIIGPEGDFTEEELRFMKNNGAVFFSLGGLTLRSETAAVAATALAASVLRCVE